VIRASAGVNSYWFSVEPRFTKEPPRPSSQRIW
jgi:hypothetical protein